MAAVRPRRTAAALDAERHGLGRGHGAGSLASVACGCCGTEVGSVRHKAKARSGFEAGGKGGKGKWRGRAGGGWLFLTGAARRKRRAKRGRGCSGRGSGGGSLPACWIKARAGGPRPADGSVKLLKQALFFC